MTSYLVPRKKVFLTEPPKPPKARPPTCPLQAALRGHRSQHGRHFLGGPSVTLLPTSPRLQGSATLRKRPSHASPLPHSRSACPLCRELPASVQRWPATPGVPTPRTATAGVEGMRGGGAARSALRPGPRCPFLLELPASTRDTEAPLRPRAPQARAALPRGRQSHQQDRAPRSSDSWDGLSDRLGDRTKPSGCCREWSAGLSSLCPGCDDPGDSGHSHGHRAVGLLSTSPQPLRARG